MKKFFISSTFYDMHAERDMIQNIVQPAVNQKLNEQGEYVSFSDLRWGIDTMSDATKHRILDACFGEIENQLGPDSLSYYSSCCFNLGQLICLYTTGGNEVGLPLVESAINILERLVNNYGLTKYQNDVEQFRRQYIALKNRR